MLVRVDYAHDGVAYCHDTHTGEDVRVAYAGTPFAALNVQLREGDELSLVDCNAVRGVVKPLLIVLEPRFLVDVTTLCACHKPYGFNAANALLAKFETRETSVPIQLGNLVNDFFDDIVNAPEGADRKALFAASLQKSFHEHPLAYTALDGIDRDFFFKADLHHQNIYRIVESRFSDAGIVIDGSELILEPSFVCPALGLQGRMDAILANRSVIIELKSGKCDEWRRDSKCKHEHELQMLLYKEMLHYGAAMPRHAVRMFLFYSQYPLFAPVEYTMPQVQQAIAVRNALVHQERLLRDGQGEKLLHALKEEDFNTNGATDRFYMNYCRPVISRFLNRMADMDSLTAAYFHAFTGFVSREQWIAKQAAYTSGAVMRGLTIHPECDAQGAVVALDCDIAAGLCGQDELDFRVGDMVVLFENSGTDDAPWGHQFFRCYITSIDDAHLHLALSYKQQGERVFNLDARYAMMAGYMEAGFSAQYRGLAAFAQAPAERRRLLLQGSEAVCALPSGLSVAEYAFAVSDYMLLVGPPGTGKTSVALRDIVLRYMAEGQTMLLMAYTNQAVDEICAMLSKVYPDFVRIGNENNCAVEHRTRMMSMVVNMARNRSEIRSTLSGLKVFVGTVSSISACDELFGLIHFDVTIVDEASQVLEPQIVPLLCRVGKFILVGDHKQLPAVVVQPREQCVVSHNGLRNVGLYNLSDSYFERLLRLDARRGGTHTMMLRRQGRMHPDIMAFVNSRFYGGRLQTVPLPHQEETMDKPRMGFIDVPYTGSLALKSNPAEAEVVARLAVSIYNEYMPFDPSKTLGVIVPFRAQITAVRNALQAAGFPFFKEMTIDTVERYQGSQRDVIIYDTTVTQPEQLDIISVLAETDEEVAHDSFAVNASLSPSAHDCFAVDRKLNVALTRARRQLFVVGCRRVLMRSALYADLICNYMSTVSL